MRGTEGKARRKEKNMQAQIRRRVQGTGKRDRNARYQNRFKAGTSLVYLGSTDKAEDLLPHKSKLPEIAIFGRSNVGKSSLMNILTGRKKMCVVSKRPGCTKALHFFCLKNSFSLVDTPGYGFARGMTPQKMEQLWNLIWLYVTKAAQRGLVLLDARRNLGSTELDLLNIFKERDLPICLVRTKMDKMNKARGHAILTETAQQLADANLKASVVGVSSLKQTGIVELWARIRSMASSGNRKARAASDGTMPSNPGHLADKNEGEGELENDEQEEEDEEEDDDDDDGDDI